MSPLTATCLFLIGTALVLSWRSNHSAARLTSIGILACMVATIAFVALYGSLAGTDFAMGWGARTRMAVHTAATFNVLSAGLLIWAWYTARKANIHFLQWVPMTASITLIVMVSMVSLASFSQFQTSNYWREHTYRVIATTQAFLSDLFSIERDATDYVFTGQSAAAEASCSAVKAGSRPY